VVVSCSSLVTDIWMADNHNMNNFKRKKLGLPPIDTVAADALEEKLLKLTPLSLDQQNKEPLSYSDKSIKNINIGTLRKPIIIPAYTNSTNNSYNQIETKTTNIFYAKGDVHYTLDGNLLDYPAKFSSLDFNNPYDPAFASFDRLISFAPTIVYSGSGINRTTGVSQGEKEKFYSTSNGNTFNKTLIIEVKSAGSSGVNGYYGITTGTINSNQSYYGDRWMNSQQPLYPDLVFTYYNSFGTGWYLRQLKNINSSTYVPIYFYSGYVPSGAVIDDVIGGMGIIGAPILPTGTLGTWKGISQTSGYSGKSPIPKVSGILSQGFFKVSQTRQSNSTKYIYATGIGSTGVSTGITSGVIPNGASLVTYPHSYNVKKYPAFLHDLVLVPQITTAYTGVNSPPTMGGFQDILLVSTGILGKDIIYISPHSVTNFFGFYAKPISTKRIPVTGTSGKIISSRPRFALNSGNLLSVSSENTVFTGLHSIYINSGLVGNGINAYYSNQSTQFYNVDTVRLQQTTAIKNTLFYKLYEPVFRSGAFNTGTWNGIIPKGTPFQIETIRTKNTNYGCTFDIKVYSKNYFVKNLNGESNSAVKLYPSGNGDYSSFISNTSIKSGVSGRFFGKALQYSTESFETATYLANSKADRIAKSKLYGALWDKGFTSTNSRVKKMIKLFNNGTLPTGIKTSAGTRTF